MKNSRVSTYSVNKPSSAEASDFAATSVLRALLLPIVDLCFSRVRRWSPPVNWSSGDWQEELLQIAWFAALEGERDFSPIRGIAFEAFVYNRIRSWSRTCYRRERLHGTRAISEVVEEELDSRQLLLGTFVRKLASLAPDEPDLFDMLREAISNLTELQRRIIHAHFWQGYTETEIGAEEGVSQNTINERKHAALRLLQEAMSKVV